MKFIATTAYLNKISIYSHFLCHHPIFVCSTVFALCFAGGKEGIDLQDITCQKFADTKETELIIRALKIIQIIRQTICWAIRE